MYRYFLIVFLALLPLAAGAGPSLERGEYLVRGPAACGNCHTPQGTDGPDMSKELAGFLVVKSDAFEAWAGNITPGSRIANWTDEELARAIREGIRPDGSVIGPPMPVAIYRGLSDDDLMSIVMFLRTVPASNIETPPSVYNIPLPQNYGPAIVSVPSIPEGVTVEYGGYLAGPVAHCVDCHTTLGAEGPMLDTHLGAGGHEFHGPWGTSRAPNLTPHSDGVSNYTDDELKVMITLGQRPDGSRMLPPMGYKYFARISPNDLDAIILYLRQLPPLPDPD